MQVFIDANAFIRMGKPPGGPLFQRLRELVSASDVQILTTSVTTTEIARRHAINDLEHLSPISRAHFRQLAKSFFDVSLPKLKYEDILNKLLDRYQREVNDQFKKLDAFYFDVDIIKPSMILRQYHWEEGFFAGSGKKDQFPDAFLFEALRLRTSSEIETFIVTDDKDFKGPVSNEPNMVLLRSIEEPFEQVGYKVEEPSIEEFLQESKEEVVELANDAVDAWGLIVGDVEDAEIYASEVQGVELENFTAFEPAEGFHNMLVIGTLRITAQVEFEHPDWDTAAYDSEDKILLPFRDVTGEIDVEFSAPFSMTIECDASAQPTTIKELSFQGDFWNVVEITPPPEHYK